MANVRGEDIVNTARSALGVQYVWGGNSLTSGVDCSGLVQQSFRKYGSELPRTTYQQINVGASVSPNKLRPGDLVFFATGTSKNEITHVGLVTDVKAKDNIKFIHSSSSLGVVETNLYADYYIKRFRGARRVIKE